MDLREMPLQIHQRLLKKIRLNSILAMWPMCGARAVCRNRQQRLPHLLRHQHLLQTHSNHPRARTDRLVAVGTEVLVRRQQTAIPTELLLLHQNHWKRPRNNCKRNAWRRHSLVELFQDRPLRLPPNGPLPLRLLHLLLRLFLFLLLLHLKWIYSI